MVKKSVNLLPTFFQTNKNSKFLSSTLDQFIQDPKLERLDGFIGSKLSKNYNPSTDNYITYTQPSRNNYQLEPGLIVRELDQSIAKAYGYDDLINQLNYHGSNTSNLNRLFKPDFYSYDPQISWDKLINFREYYWLPTGPSPIKITGTQRELLSTFNVTDSPDENFFIFTPDGITTDPQITLYRGVTYIFNVKSKHNFYIRNSAGYGPDDLYTLDVTGNGASNGQVIITVSYTAPNELYYAAGANQNAGGQFIIKTIDENSKIDVEKEIVGKSQFKSASGVEFINGLRVQFGGDVTPAYYRDKDFIVEGVGNKINLVDFRLLDTPENIATQYDADFDASNFDEFPFDNFKNLPITPAYITINRASKDLNSWTRYNRWFHADVIKAVADYNGQIVEYPVASRAQRPIIEFKPNLQLFNFGNIAVANVDVIDNTTTDVFSNVEKGFGYWVDGVQLEPGFRVIFNADPDPLVRGRIYEVTFVDIDGDKRVNLIETSDNIPVLNGCTTILRGTENGGTVWWYTKDSTGVNKWIKGQQRTELNQAPLFDIFDNNGYSYSGYPYTSNFKGCKVFGYAVGSGTADSVLGFPLQYKSTTIESSYLFNNYFSTDIILRAFPDTGISVPVNTGYLRYNSDINNPTYLNVWTDAAEYNIPVIQFQTAYDLTSSIEITTFDDPGYIDDIVVNVFVNDLKYNSTQYALSKSNSRLFVEFIESIPASTTGHKIRFEIYSATSPNTTGYYATPLNLTNNPLNGPVAELTLSELYDHVHTMVDRDSNFLGTFPGVSNLDRLTSVSKYGTRIISNKNPLSFSHYFISDKENNLIEAIRAACDDYAQFKLNLIKAITQTANLESAAKSLDLAMIQINENKDISFPYLLSDMLPYGSNKKTRTYTVTDRRNLSYSISSVFNLTTLSNSAVLVYLNGTQLIYGLDYEFDLYDTTVNMKVSLTKGDIITIQEYHDTDGCYIPSTPTKLGLYPKFEPKIYLDTSYADDPVNVIQGHDGSLMVAFNDYRDDILLEYEKRVYNNLKTTYNPQLFDINTVLPGVFRTEDHSYADTYDLVQSDFLKWTGFYGIDYESHTFYQIDNHKTYNYKSATDYLFGKTIPGSWRAIYKYYFDTDRPNTHPWEMLGISIKPDWWDSYYGPAPYTAGNLKLWTDLRDGRIAQGDNAGINPLYARPNLFEIIPVDDSGNTIDVRSWASIAKNDSVPETTQPWAFSDWGPAENAWRRSSNWPFAVQLIAALSKPADYSAKLFDTSRMNLNSAGQYTYGDSNYFLAPSIVALHSDVVNKVKTRGAGYSVYVIELGKKRQTSYVSQLKTRLQNGTFNLFAKLGGFVSKDKLSVVIDAVQPGTQNPTPYLPNEDYDVFFNTGNPVKSIAISGLIIIKSQGKFILRGYDRKDLFFKINKPIHQASDKYLSVGTKTEDFVTWTANQFYIAGQVVLNEAVYYRAISDHKSTTSFDSKYFKALDKLPSAGGISVTRANNFETEETIVRYGTVFSTLQDIYDFMIGYGHWLEGQGFTFNDYNEDFREVINWDFSAKELIYWTTQNWADNSVITLSPFANSLEFTFQEGVVDNIFDSFYNYSILRSDGLSFPSSNFNLVRNENKFTINTRSTPEGIFFVRLNLVQKEHALIFNNTTIFGDVLYDIDTGYRQLRVKLKGFKTSEWNGSFFSPGFVYDTASVESWTSYKDYLPGDVVEYVGKYYSAKKKIAGTEKFEFASWFALTDKPVANLLPNFEYKINQFEDFYSLDIDNFDSSQQKMAQHLIGYSPRSYLENIFDNPISQYKFYQGFIKEKGTKNALLKLEKASTANLQGTLELNEEWAFRLGYFGAYTNFEEIELPLREADFVENNQSIEFVDAIPSEPNALISYITSADLAIKPFDYSASQTFKVTTSTYADNNLILPHAGYVRVDDIQYVFTSTDSLLTLEDNSYFRDGDRIWTGFEPNGEWNVYRYSRHLRTIIGATADHATVIFTTNKPHGLRTGQVISIVNADPNLDGIYKVKGIQSVTEFIVDKTVLNVPNIPITGIMFKLQTVRVSNVDALADLNNLADFRTDELFWADDNGSGKWSVYRRVDNYNAVEYMAPRNKPNQQYGHSISKQANSSTVVISASNFIDPLVSKGRVYIYEAVDGILKSVTNYGLNTQAVDQYRQTFDTAPFGDSVFYDETDDLIFATAPDASFIKPDTNGLVRQAKATNSVSTLTNVGLLKISGLFRSPTAYKVEIPYAVLVNPNPENRSRFGAGFHVERNQFNKKLLVGAPNFYLSTSTGQVYRFNVNISDLTRTYTGITGTNATGQLASFNISVDPGSRVYHVSIANSGTQYVTDTYDHSFITITGDRLGGLVPDNNLNIKISSAYQLREVNGTITNSGTISTITRVSNVLGMTEGTLLVQRSGGTGSFGGGIAKVISVDYTNLDNLKITVEATNGVNTTGTVLFRYGGTIESIDLVATTGTAATRSFTITTPVQTTLTLPNDVSPGEEFGFRISGNKDSTVIAVSSPGYNRGIGAVYIYNYIEDQDEYHFIQAIKGSDPEFNKSIRTGDRLGTTILVSETGDYLFVSSVQTTDGATRPGKVSIYKWDATSNKFAFLQMLLNPSKEPDLHFGHALSLTPDAKTLVVTSQGSNLFNGINFDGGQTTFDNDSCLFGDIIRFSGTAYVFNRYNTKFLLAQELFDTTIDAGSYYGESVAMDDQTVYVGSPDNRSILNPNGSVYTWTEIDPTINSWQEYRTQSDLIDINLIQKASTIDALKEQVVDYLDIIDPIKGKIPGLADQEIRFKTPFDPAIYSFGTDEVTTDTDGFWADEHIGELWWDLSKVKYVWYEQGDPTYRKLTWGQMFPGSSIDVYEWVKTIYPPSQWATYADTNEGLALGISGKPRFMDDSVFSSRQTFNGNTSQFVTYYYYWVKNTTIVPAHLNRRISANEVSRLIEDPKSYGLKYLSVLGPDSISLTNFKSNLINERIFLNISYNRNNSDVGKHTEWALIQENNQYSNPPALLEKKLIDSLLGKDSLGNLVPDPSLPARSRYGIEIRPRQSMFVNRMEALRNLIDYTNTILEQNLTRGYISFVNLDSKEEIPDILLGEYDEIYEDIEGRDTVITNNFVRAQLSCVITNGRISSVIINNPGYGYKQAPSVNLINEDTDAKIKTVIDASGRVVDTIIVNSGNYFAQPPRLLVRAYTVIVQIDPDYNNKWSKYEWDDLDNSWLRIHTQKFDTTKYWKYIDWIDSSYNPYKLLAATVDELYELATLTLEIGDYVKVKNPGDGKYIILRKSLTNGTFDTDFDIVYSEQGTIQIRDSVWNVESAQLGFDNVTTFDQLVFDESSEIELQKIVTAIKEDIFAGPLKAYWNKFFFKAVKYALTEQRFLDWAFKTSFINVKNKAGVLDQRSTYRYQDPTWYEDYLKEIKPYHTNIRNYQIDYQIGDSAATPWEPTNTFTTDFDLPAVYDNVTQMFSTPEEYMFTEYPYKAWNNNNSYSVESITLSSNGSGYRAIPRVDIITAPGDTGEGATAIARVALGKVVEIEITNSGKNYKKTPTVVISGGGDTLLYPAVAYPNLSNRKVRSNTIGIKFDRITSNTSTFVVSSQQTTATFFTSGADFKFKLPWYASLDNTSTTVTIGDNPDTDGIIIVKSSYTIDNTTAYSSKFNYHKQTSTLVLDIVPPRGKYLRVSYNKNIDLYSAAERIRDYYTPTSGMPGNQLEQLMDGVSFPGTIVKGLPFSADAGWDNIEFESTSWDTYNPDSFYSSVTTATNTQTFILPTITSGTVITVYVEQFDDSGIRTGYTRIDSTGTSSLVTTIVGEDTTASVTIPAIAFTATSAFSKVVFRTIDSGSVFIPQEIDTVYDAGTLAYSNLAGLSPTSIILDGNEFVSPYTSYGPEELVPGQVEESISINVFTREEQGSPLIAVQSHLVELTSTSTVVGLRVQPANTSSVMVSFGGNALVYGRDYSINFVDKTVTINQTTSTGIAGITVVSVGGNKLLASTVVTTSSTTVKIEGIPSYDEINSVYITCNGEKLIETAGTGLGYTLKPKSAKNRSSILTVQGMSTGTNIVQAWFFESVDKGFSEVKEQIVTINTTTTTIDLLQPPGILGPLHAQVIVEHNGKRLTPPDTTYYQISNDGQTVFNITDEESAPGIYDLSQLEIHVNGIRQKNGINFLLSQLNNTVVFNDGYLVAGDVLAISILLYADYIIKNNQLVLSNSVSSGTLKIITYTTHDSSSIRTEVFRSSNINLFRMARPILDDNYVWVSVNGEPLINRIDFNIQQDKQTIKVNDKFTVGKANNKVVITSFTDVNVNKAVGYRIFKDMLGMTHYKRFSDKNTTALTQEFNITDTEIHVENAKLLSIPSIKNNAPGVVFIGSERIEYFTVTNNILGQLRRATYGTGAKENYITGTAVIDASRLQTVPYAESVQRVTTTTVDTIQTVFKLDGIYLNHNVKYEDQVEVRYAGRVLNKNSSTVHNNELAYDSNEYSSDISVNAEFNVITTGTGVVYKVIEKKKLALVYITTATEIAENIQTVILTQGTHWTVPADFTSDNIIEVYGAGGGGDATPYSGAGGGGGGYASISNVVLTTGTVIEYSIGQPGNGGLWTNVNPGGTPVYHHSLPSNGDATWFGAGNTTTSFVYATGGVAARGEFGGIGGSGGVGFSGTNYVSSLMSYTGGNGGNLGVGTGGGGGGAAGPEGPGFNGQDGQDPEGTVNLGGGQGGGGAGIISGVGGTVGYNYTLNEDMPQAIGIGAGGAGTPQALIGQAYGHAGTGTSGAILIQYRSTDPLVKKSEIIPVITTVTTTATVAVPVTITYDNPVLLLNFTPEPNVKISVLSHTGKTWYDQGTTAVGILESTTPQAIFLLERQSGLLDKYQYGKL